ncbi:gliding motility-associated C-terminal domain-containing protein [Fluviicola sp.]|uniref:T9SS type B sorting domain-containing protein n=1 Tax=Fluviicola sp. TaxID=1917219 RepID=UPI002830AD7B|nr:gliding motility-associated C-terminal domain-containing protein [Fluviicola sp.]MDR0803321.1 gliding motility-associated C-terminal domain-containing protein [Fluviicola sp.]
MKTVQYILVVAGFFFSTIAQTQVNPGNACSQAGCSVSGAYANGNGPGGPNNAPSMGTYGCLFSTPNASWLALGIQSNGDVHLVLTENNCTPAPCNGGNGIDVDFALYGPFPNVSAGCPIGPGTPTVDCSYSASATEYVDVIGAVAGQVYILLVTNFNGSAGTISLQPASNQTATINCNINFSGTTSSTPATCNQATGSVTVTPVGGFPPYTYSWSTPGNPTTQTVTNVLPGTYTVTITSSNGPLGETVNPTTATVTVANINATYSATSTPASCPLGLNGTATANFAIPGSSSGITATYHWSDPSGQTTKTATGLLPGTYVCTITLSNGCTGTATATVGANPVTYSATSTLVSCPGGSDGTVTANMNPVVGTLSYSWNDPAAQSTQTATGLPAGSYSCIITSNIGCTGTVNVTVSEIPGMIASFDSIRNVTCNSGNDGVLKVAVTQGTAPYSYSWNYSASASNIASDLLVGTTTVTVTDTKGCVITKSQTLTQPDPLKITFLTQDEIICPEDSTLLSVQGVGGSSPYIFTWKENGTVIGTGTSIYVNPLTTGTQYCVELTEQCGSPSVDSCMMINFPTPIKPKFVSNIPYSCLPGEFVFINQSTFGPDDKIDSMIADFGNGDVMTFYGDTDLTYTYTSAGIYTLHVTVTSESGCVTDSTFFGIANVIANPVADFTMSANPTTIFETVVIMQDKSSPNVVSWTWYAPGSNPNHSTYENPTFHYPEGVIETYPIQLIVETPEGCVDTVEHILSVISDIIFYAPNAFTPDGDEFNQRWKFYVSGIDEYNFELLIFDRWGEIIWETHDVNSTWDGTYNGEPVTPGAYTWVARVKEIYTDSKKVFNGVVNVLK